MPVSPEELEALYKARKPTVEILEEEPKTRKYYTLIKDGIQIKVYLNRVGNILVQGEIEV